MKKFLMVMLAALVMVCLPILPARAEIPVYIGDDLMKWTVPPQMVGNTMLVPVADVCDMLGADYEWHKADQTVTLTREFDHVGVWMQVGNNQALINDYTSELEVPPIISNGHVLVPLRFSAEAMSETVQWDTVDKVARITRSHTEPSGDEDRVWVGMWNVEDENIEILIKRDDGRLWGYFYKPGAYQGTFEGSGNGTTATLDFEIVESNPLITGVLQLRLWEEGNYFDATYEEDQNPASKQDWLAVRVW